MVEYRGITDQIKIEQLPSPDNRFTLQDIIGEGTYGEVFCARDNEMNLRVAIKILENIRENIEEIEEEYLVLKSHSRHPNITDFYGIFFKRGPTLEEDQIWFVVELCTGGSVTDLVQGLKHRNERLSYDQLAYILRETVEALVYLHANHCMHRDVKGHNILLTERAHVKLIDFGVSSHLMATMARRNTSVGTPYWMAPEVIACEQQLDAAYDTRCDVWSLGITAIELADGDAPLCELHPMRALFQIPRNPPPTVKDSEFYGPILSDFISECLVKDMEHRPFVNELVHHPLFKNVAETREKVRKQLQSEISKQRKEGRVHQKSEVTTKNGKLKSSRKSVAKQIYVDDLAALELLSEDVIVEQLFRRFELQQIYTYIGDILLAVNPFCDLGLYTIQKQKIYKGQARSNNPPHIFAAADQAYQALLHQKQSQSVVISGESGAGKTLSANLLLKQLVFLSKGPEGSLENRILEMNPIMEAFGNAKTGINSNSSRFGKYLDLFISDSGKITGARISVYLLEQSRVVKQAINEGNFHIFYYLYDGLENMNNLIQYHLDPVLKNSHKYLKPLPESKVTNINMWKQLENSFKVVGFHNDEIDTIIRILSAVLHLGDLEFGEVLQNNTDNKSRIIDLAPMHRVTRLLGIDPSDLLEALTCNSVVTRGETIIRNNSIVEAEAVRNAMAKSLYGRLFDWIVNQMNCLLLSNRNNDQEQQSIGILDIFGFENFTKNSFEQLCINIANEQLQYFFNQHIFTWEQQEYMAEGVPVDLVEFSDNKPVLDMLLSKPVGLLALLDEESRFPKSNDRTMIEKFHNNVRSKHYVKPKSDAACFAIQHFAGRVIYRADGFLNKNRNFLPPDIINLLRQSQYDMIRFLYQCPITKTGNLYSAIYDSNDGRSSSRSSSRSSRNDKFITRYLASQSRAQQTVATYFRYSLKDLLQKMVAGNPQFVRCIKPNELSTPQLFDRAKVLKQLRYAGVLETIRIRQQGFSHRILFEDFVKRYCFLGFAFNEKVKPNRESCRLLLVRLKMDGWALGKTKVFLKYYHVEYLSKLYEEQMHKIILSQACVRRWLAMLQYKKLRWNIRQTESAVTMQKVVRGFLTRKRLARQRKENRISACQKAISGVTTKNKWMPPSAKSRGPISDMQDIVQSKLMSSTNEEDRDTHNTNMAAVLQNLKNNKLNNKPNKKYNEIKVSKVIEDNINVRLPKPKMKSHHNNLTHPEFDRQNDFVNLSRQVHLLNQTVHKYLRRNKPAIRMEEIQPAPTSYVQPSGFTLIRKYLQSHYPATVSDSGIHSVNDDSNSSSSEFDEESSNEWDTPLVEKENKLRPVGWP
ncbi:myosin-IIIa-like [Chrysoperla carnea]|uniref:myosin-IIIa-like n=1 Tax=Chrysoperla carnea TaxID=189513 RepID=UPI001D084417|nr:myosin-IIIa-like [Chrysoperla carnea]